MASLSERLRANPYARSRRWTQQQDTLLELLLPLHTYPEIAAMLGKSATAVQYRACHVLRISKRGEAAEAREAWEQRSAAERLRASEEELSEYLPECDEMPYDPVKSKRRKQQQTYAEAHRERIREQQRRRYAEDPDYRARRVANAAKQREKRAEGRTN